jgi:hypothetical protein
LIKEGAISQCIDKFYNTLIESGMYQQIHTFKGKVKIFEKENEVYEFLDSLKKYFGNCAGCTSDSGFELCDVRKCAKARKVTICSECSDYDKCDLIRNKF